MMRSDPLVSIVLPTHNGSRYILEALESCASQTYPNVEMIVVDDASSDATPVIVAGWAAGRNNVRVVRHERNRRLPAALNTGFSQARGDYLTWTSDDNIYEPDAIQLMFAHLENHPQTGLVYCDCREIDPDGTVLGITRKKEPDALATENTVGACFLYRRAVYEAVGDYDPDMVLVEDYEYWLRVAKQFRIDHLGAAPYRYRSHPESLSRKFNGRIMFQVAKARCRHVVPERERERVIAESYRAAYACFRAVGDLDAAWECARHCLRRSPYRLNYWRSLIGTAALRMRAKVSAQADTRRPTPGLRSL